jgi:tetratricopeptide (TPR) repeat protein
MQQKNDPVKTMSAPRNKQYYSPLIGMGIAVITFLFLKTCLNDTFTNWDDIQYIKDNALIKDLSGNGLRAIFSTPVLGNYHPLTILSYAFDYAAAGMAPWLYHFDSLVLHCIATLLVYWLALLLFKRPMAAAIASLLFGLHPMHVESVAWLSGRKDELCAIFYVGACITYVYQKNIATLSRSRSTMLYASTLLLFVCALLSKPVAVTLPASLLLIDQLQNRKWDARSVLEKAPHFLLAIAFGIIAITAQHAFGAVGVHQRFNYNALDRLAIGSYALAVYLAKAVVPTNLHCFYPYPVMHDGLSLICYAAIPAIAVLAFITWKLARGNKIMVFGLLFFLINIVLLLQFVPVGDAIVAERYTYIPYIGLFFFAGWYISYLLEKKDIIGKPVLGAAVLYLLWLGILSKERCAVWYDSATLWSDELRKQPDNETVAYTNLSAYYFDAWNTSSERAERHMAYDSALYLFQRCTELMPDSSAPYQALGMLRCARHDVPAALAYFGTSVRLNPTAEAHSNFGNFLVLAGLPDSALLQYDTALSQNPDLFNASLGRGKILIRKNRFTEAMSDLNAARALNPDYAETYYERSFCDTAIINKSVALKDVETALSLGYTHVDSTYYSLLKQ